MSYTELEAGYQGLRRSPAAGFYIGEDNGTAIVGSSGSGLSTALQVGTHKTTPDPRPIRPSLGLWFVWRSYGAVTASGAASGCDRSPPVTVEADS